jgi:SHS2 domain-containing protein
MFQIEYLSHTADVRIRVAADSPEELFQAGAVALNRLLKPGFCEENASETTVHEAIEVESVDRTALFIDFLSELLTLTLMERAIFCEVQILLLSAHRLSARVSGHLFDEMEEDIKAVTYHEADVHLNDEGQWETLVIFDI